MLIYQSKELNRSGCVTLQKNIVHPQTCEGHVYFATSKLFDYVLATMEWAVKKSSFRNEFIDCCNAALVLVGDDCLVV